jgi:hypothetical protein
LHRGNEVENLSFGSIWGHIVLHCRGGSTWQLSAASARLQRMHVLTMNGS